MLFCVKESNGPTDSYAAISEVDRLQSEPESIRKWREEQTERLEALGKEPICLRVSVFSGVVDLDSTFIPFKLRLAMMSLSGLWEAAFLSLKVTRPPTWTCFITGYEEHGNREPAPPGRLSWDLILLTVWALGSDLYSDSI